MRSQDFAPREEASSSMGDGDDSSILSTRGKALTSHAHCEVCLSISGISKIDWTLEDGVKSGDICDKKDDSYVDKADNNHVHPTAAAGVGDGRMLTSTPNTSIIEISSGSSEMEETVFITEIKPVAPPPGFAPRPILPPQQLNPSVFRHVKSPPPSHRFPELSPVLFESPLSPTQPRTPSPQISTLNRLVDYSDSSSDSDDENDKEITDILHNASKQHVFRPIPLNPTHDLLRGSSDEWRVEDDLNCIGDTNRVQGAVAISPTPSLISDSDGEDEGLVEMVVENSTLWWMNLSAEIVEDMELNKEYLDLMKNLEKEGVKMDGFGEKRKDRTPGQTPNEKKTKNPSPYSLRSSTTKPPVTQDPQPSTSGYNKTPSTKSNNKQMNAQYKGKGKGRGKGRASLFQNTPPPSVGRDPPRMEFQASDFSVTHRKDRVFKIPRLMHVATRNFEDVVK